ncbi:MAG: creatininase family protein [Bacteroidota bacterium]|nr:creatininase family protein [Bacteroidota bacterium]MDE2958063.1 creatininase family protein [Bacteroidota bacterium]
MRPYILAETNWTAVRSLKVELAVLPWGATEAHNLHLPYATDNMQLDHIAAESARIAWEDGARVMVLPTIPFGVNTGQLDIPLDINMMPSTQMAVLRDVAHCLSGQGVTKLVILNGHGGNNFRQMIREVGSRFPDLFLCEINWFRVLDGTEFFDEPGDHAGELETSCMMHISPELVLPLEKAGDGRAVPFRIRGFQEGWAWAERQWSQVTRDTGVGDPSAATPEKGRRFLQALTHQIAGFMVELARCDNLYLT